MSKTAKVKRMATPKGPILVTVDTFEASEGEWEGDTTGGWGGVAGERRAGIICTFVVWGGRGKKLFRLPESEAARCIDSLQLFGFGSPRQAKLLDDSEPRSH